MKKIILSALCVSLFLACFAGCKTSPSPEGSSNPSPDAPLPPGNTVGDFRAIVERIIPLCGNTDKLTEINASLDELDAVYAAIAADLSKTGTAEKENAEKELAELEASLLKALGDSTSLQPELATLTVGNVKITAAEYNYQYFSVYDSTLGYIYSSGISEIMDFLDFNPYDLNTDASILQFNGTLGEYLIENTAELIKKISVYSELAKANGLTFSDADRERLDRIVAMYTDDYAAFYNQTYKTNLSVDEYLQLYYGNGVTKDRIRAAEERRIWSDIWKAHAYDNYSESDILDFYNSQDSDGIPNKLKCDLVTYHAYTVSGAHTPVEGQSEADKEAAKKAAMAEAKMSADAMLAKVNKPEDFPALAKEYEGKDVSTLHEGYSGGKVSTELLPYLFDDSRKSGDKTVVETNSGFTVLLFVERGKDTRQYLPSIRHILIQSAADPKNATPEEKKAARDNADDILAEWKSGAKTSDSFSALAKKYTQDDSTKDSGGLCENMQLDEMVAPFEKWAFAPERKPGDVGVIDSEFGSHVMYFASGNSTQWEALARDGIFNAESEAIFAQTNIKNHSYSLKLTKNRELNTK